MNLEDIKKSFREELVEMHPMHGRDSHKPPPLYNAKDGDIKEIEDWFSSALSLAFKAGLNRAVEVIGGMFPNVCSLCNNPITCVDHYEENSVIFCPHTHHECKKNSTAICFDVVCGEKEIGREQARKEIKEALTSELSKIQ